MRAVFAVSLLLAGLGLAGCMAYDVASTAVEAGASAAGTAVDAAAGVARGTVRVVGGGQDRGRD